MVTWVSFKRQSRNRLYCSRRSLFRSQSLNAGFSMSRPSCASCKPLCCVQVSFSQFAESMLIVIFEGQINLTLKIIDEPCFNALSVTSALNALYGKSCDKPVACLLTYVRKLVLLLDTLIDCVELLPICTSLYYLRVCEICVDTYNIMYNQEYWKKKVVGSGHLFFKSKRLPTKIVGHKF